MEYFTDSDSLFYANLLIFKILLVKPSANFPVSAMGKPVYETEVRVRLKWEGKEEL